MCFVECEDRYEFCKQPAIKALCDEEVSISDVICRKTCGVCGGGPEDLPQSCNDKWSSFWCTVYQFSCFTDAVRTKCRKTCNLCP